MSLFTLTVHPQMYAAVPQIWRDALSTLPATSPETQATQNQLSSDSN